MEKIIFGILVCILTSGFVVFIGSLFIKRMPNQDIDTGLDHSPLPSDEELARATIRYQNDDYEMHWNFERRIPMYSDPVFQNLLANAIACCIWGFLLVCMTSRHLLKIRVVTHSVYAGCGSYIMSLPMLGKSILFVMMFGVLLLLSNSAQGMFTED